MHGRLKGSLLATLAVSVVFAAGTGAARADDTIAEIRALKAQLRALEAKVDAQARSQRATQHAVAEVAAKGAVYSKGPPPVLALTCPPGAFSLKAVCITPGGYIDATNIFRTRNLESDLSTPWNSIPFNNNKVGHTREDRFTARASRFSLQVDGDVDKTTHLKAYGEVDFQGAAQTANSNGTNSYNPRLRQAYFALDKSDWGVEVVAGQSWSLATMFKSGLAVGKENIPPTIDQQYLPGFTYTRQPQIRIVKNFGPSFAIGLSAENPATTTTGTVPANVVATSLNGCGLAGTAVNPSGDNNFNSCNTLSLNHIPDFVGKFAWDPQLGDRTLHFEGYGLLRDFYDRTEGFAAAAGLAPGAATGLTKGNHDVFGGGVGGSVLIPLFPKVLDVQFSGLTGSGVGRYGAGGLPDATFSYPTPGNPGTGALRPIESTQLLAGVTLHATSWLDIYAFGGEEFAQRKFTPGTASGTGYGNPASINTGCFSETSTSTCIGNTKSLQSATIGFWDVLYNGGYGKLQAGAEYNFTRRESFSGVGGTPKADENIILTSLRYFPF